MRRVTRRTQSTETAAAALVNLAREVLRGRPARTLLELIARLAPFCLALAAFTATWGGSSGASIAPLLVYLLGLLLLLAAADQWIVVPLRRGLGGLGRLITRRWRARDRGA